MSVVAVVVVTVVVAAAVVVIAVVVVVLVVDCFIIYLNFERTLNSSFVCVLSNTASASVKLQRKT